MTLIAPSTYRIPHPLKLSKLIQFPNRTRHPCKSIGVARKHHIVALQYCFETVHRLILAARQRAAKSPVTPEMMNKIIRDREKIQAAFDQLVERLNAFMMLTMWRIQDIRLRYQTKNYLCHLFPVLRWCA